MEEDAGERGGRSPTPATTTQPPSPRNASNPAGETTILRAPLIPSFPRSLVPLIVRGRENTQRRKRRHQVRSGAETVVDDEGRG